MTKTKQRSDIESLLADRARYEAWLEQLAAKASQVSDHVVQRVRGDYEERLNQVVEELRSRADELKSEGDTLAARIEVLDSELNAKRDARAEDELRAMVGEFDEGVWEGKRGDHDRGIERLETERSGREADLSRIRGLLNEATRPTRAIRAMDIAIPEEPTPVDAVTAAEVAAAVSGAFRTIDQAAAADLEAAKAPPPVAPPAAPVAAAPAPAPAPPPSEPAPRQPSPFDELAFLKTVVGRPTPHAGVSMQPPTSAPPSPPPGPPPSPPLSPTPELRPSGALEAPVPERSSRGVPPSVPPAPRISQAPPLPPPPAPVASAPVAPPVEVVAPQPVTVPPTSPPMSQPAVQASPRRPSIPSFEPPPLPDAPSAAPARSPTPSMPSFDLPSDISVGQPTPARGSAGASLEGSRSLKCQECGWMNYPTEWYCEKCGGELAAF